MKVANFIKFSLKNKMKESYSMSPPGYGAAKQRIIRLHTDIIRLSQTICRVKFYYFNRVQFSPISNNACLCHAKICF